MGTNEENKPAQSSGIPVGRLLEGNACVLLATIFFGINIPVVKLLIPQWMTAVDVTLWRILGGCALMWLASLFVRTQPIQRRHWGKIALGGALGLFSFLYLFNLSLRYADPIDVSIILTFPPVFVLLIQILFRHYRPSLMEVLGLAVSFVGAFLVIVTQHGGEAGSDNLLGDMLALASSLCYAFYLVIIEEPSHEYRPVNLLRWLFLAAAVPALFFVGGFPQAEIFHTTDITPWLLIGFVLLCPTFLSYFLMNPAIKMIGSELVSLYQYFIPVVATIASVLMHVATLHWIQVLAMIVIVAGMALTDIGKRRMAKSK